MTNVGVSKEMQLPDADILGEMRASGADLPPLAAVTVSVNAYGAQLVALPVYLETLEKLTDEDAVAFGVGGNCDFRVFEISSDFGRAATVHAPNANGKVIIEGINNSTKNYMVLVVGLHDTGIQSCDVIVELVLEDDVFGPFVGIRTMIDASENLLDSGVEFGSETEMSFLFEVIDWKTGECRFLVDGGGSGITGFISRTAGGNFHYEGEGELSENFRFKYSLDITDNGTKLSGTYTYEGSMLRYREEAGGYVQIDEPAYYISTIVAAKQ